MFNHSVSSPPQVPVPQPYSGQDPSFCTPEGIVGSHREFQGDGMDWVPSGSWLGVGRIRLQIRISRIQHSESRLESFCLGFESPRAPAAVPHHRPAA